MPDQPSRVLLLTKHFFRRFFDNDVISPNGDGHEHLSTILAAMAVPGLFISTLLAMRYLNPLASPGERLLFSLPDKLLLFSGSMFVMALVTVLEWDALSLDARDHEILGTLPIERRVLAQAKLASLVQFVAVFAVAINAVPAVVYPSVFMAQLPIGILRALWVLVAFAAVSLAASAFGFAAVLAVRETLRALCGPRVFRRLSTPVQFTGVLALASAILLLPAVPSRGVMTAFSSGSAWLDAWPPVWFVGLYETITASTILEAPGTDAPSPRGYWTAEDDRAARAAYHGMDARFRDFAITAVVALATCWAIALLMFALVARRHVEPPPAGRPGRLRRAAPALAARLLVRRPLAQAGFFFTLQALLRSADHRLYFAGYLAGGAGAALVIAGPRLLPGLTEPGQPELQAVFVVQMVVTAFVIAGLRAAFALPVTLPANWVFQVCWIGDARWYQMGVRAAVGVLLAAFLCALLPLHVIWLEFPAALTHLAIGWLAAMLAAELLILGSRHLPFTCAYAAGRGNLKTWWAAYLAAFLAYTGGFAAIERYAFADPRGTIALALVLGAALAIAIGVRGFRRPAVRVLEVEEEPDVTQALGLGG